jgi:hypothetical protein
VRSRWNAAWTTERAGSSGIRRELPEEIRKDLVGKGLTAVADHPALGDPRIRKAVDERGDLPLDIRRAERCFDRSTGRLV